MTDDQLERFKTHAPKAAVDLCRIIINHAEELIALAQTRAETIGVEEYGDTSYHLTNEVLEHELWCELADAIFYNHLRISSGKTI